MKNKTLTYSLIAGVLVVVLVQFLMNMVSVYLFYTPLPLIAFVILGIVGLLVLVGLRWAVKKIIG